MQRAWNIYTLSYFWKKTKAPNFYENSLRVQDELLVWTINEVLIKSIKRLCYSQESDCLAHRDTAHILELRERWRNKPKEFSDFN